MKANDNKTIGNNNTNIAGDNNLIFLESINTEITELK